MITFISGRLPWFDSQFCLLLTWALVHFVWQGFALAVAFAVVRRVLVRRSANARYAAGLVTLILMAACLPANLVLIDPAAMNHPPVAIEHVVITSEAHSPIDENNFTRPARRGMVDVPAHGVDGFGNAISTTDVRADDGQNFRSRVAGALNGALASISTYAAFAYTLGLALMLTRVFVGLSIGHRLRRASTPISEPAMLDFLRSHAKRLALRATPAIAWCSRVSVPVVVGVLRPMILLPCTLATGLTDRQLQYVLLHELAHIHRYDPLANLLERLIEALLFFHPAVWWLTRQVRIERENACDDAVLQAGCQGPAYGEALLRVAELCASIPGRAVSPASLLAATGENPSQLARRVMRLFNTEPPAHVRSATPAVAMLVLLGAFTIIALAAWRSPAIAQVAKDPSPVQRPEPRDKPAPPPPAAAGETTRIEGRVVDGDKKPVAEAEVSAVVLTRLPKTDIRAGSTQAFVLQQVKTDSHGDFRLQVRRTAEPDDIAIEVFAAKPGSAIDWRSFDVGAAQYKATLTLVSETPLQGQALDPTGKPATGATLWLAGIRKTGEKLDNHSGRFPFWRPPQPWQSWPTAVETDDDGKFVLHGVGRDSEIRVEAKDERFAHQWWTFDTAHGAATNPITITLTPPRVVEGTVTLKGDKRPAAGATVVLTSHDDEVFQGAVDCRTDADGHFRLMPYYGDKLEIRVFPPPNEPYEKLLRTIPWVDGTVTQAMRLSLARSAKSDTETEEIGSDSDSPSPEAHAESPSVAPLEASISEMKPSAEKARRLTGRIFASGVIEVTHAGGEQGAVNGVFSIDPSDGSWSAVAEMEASCGVSSAGGRLAFITIKAPAGAWVCDIRGAAKPVLIFPKASGAIWAPDGNSLVIELPAPAPREYRGQEHWGEEEEKWQVQVDGSNRVRLQLPPTHDLNDWSPDGKWIITNWDHHSPEGAHLYVMHPDGTAQRQLTRPGFHYSWHGRFSPDGRQIAYQHLENRGGRTIRIVDFDGSNDHELFATHGSTEPEMACWSPDGHFLAVLVFDETDEGQSNYRILILDTAGGYRGTIQLKNAAEVSLNDIDWQ